MNIKEMSLVAISKLEGVGDLPITVRSKFAQALKAEANGETEKANTKLNEAVAEEVKRNKT